MADNENTTTDGDNPDEEFQMPGTEYVKYLENASEMFTTISENYELHSGTASVQIKCKWDDRHQVVSSFLEGGDHANPVEFPFPLGESGTPLVATSVRIDPMQTKYETDGQAIVYKYALITLSYSMMATNIDVQSTTQWLQIYPNGLYWKIKKTPAPQSNEQNNNDNGGENQQQATEDEYEEVQVAQDEVPGIKFPSYDITLSHPHIKSVFEGGNFSQYEGYVNSDHLTVWYNGVEFEFQPETLLCTSPSIKAGANLFGSGFNEVSLKLSYNPLTHNKFFNPKQNMGNPSATLEDHAVEMYTKDENGERRIIIFPQKPFKPIFEAFKFRVTGGDDFVGDVNELVPDSAIDNDGDGGTTNPELADLGINDGQHTGGE